MAATTRRKSAEERREEIHAIAIEHVAAAVAAGDVWAFFANGMLLNIVAALELQDMAVLAHAHPVSACGEQHGTQRGRRAELDEDVLSRVYHVPRPAAGVGLGEARDRSDGGGVSLVGVNSGLSAPRPGASVGVAVPDRAPKRAAGSRLVGRGVRGRGG